MSQDQSSRSGAPVFRSWPALVTFALVAMLAGVTVWRTEESQREQEREQVKHVAATYAAAVQRDIERGLSATYPLAALVRRAAGNPEGFQALATQMLPFYQGASALALAPGGVVREIVPLLGNEKAIGHDLMRDPQRDKEAFMARDTGRLTLAGPFALVQGGLAAAGRLPVYLDSQAGGREHFWGFVSVLVRFPEVLESARLDQFAKAGHAYELWRVHPDTGARHSIAAAGGELVDPVMVPVVVPNATWTFSAAPVGGWLNAPRLFGKLALALLISTLAGWLASLLVRDRRHRQVLVSGIEAATRELRMQEKVMSSAFEAAPIGISIASPEGQIVNANRRTEEILGLSRDEHLRRWVTSEQWQMVRPDGSPMPPDEFPAMRALTEHARVDAVEMGLVRSDGVRWLLVSAVPSPDPRFGTIVTYADISARKRAEDALRASEARLSATLATAIDAVVCMDRHGLLVEFNTAAEALFGWRREEVIGRSMADLIIPERYRAAHTAGLAHFVSTREAKMLNTRIEISALRRDGSEFPAELAVATFQEGNSDVFVGFLRDISTRKAAHRALAESEAHYRKLFTESNIVMLLIDPADGRIRDANDAAIEFYGYPQEALTEMNISAINTLPSDRIKAEMERAKAEKRTYFDFRHRLRSGEIRDVQVSSGPIEIGGQTLLLSTVLDVTERRRGETRMREALVVFNASTQGIMTTDADGIITSINPAFSTITGYSPAEVIGRRPSIFKSGRHDEAFYQAMWDAVLEHGKWEGEIWNRRRNGQIYPMWQSISSVRDKDGRVVEFVALFSDITERKEQEEAIWRQANFDSLTGLANRNLLADRLERALVQARRHRERVGLAFLDLDGFKWINDTLGHDVGDELLVEVARRLGSTVRNEDTAARLGGDEFTVIIQHLVASDDMINIGEKLVESLRAPITLAGATHQISVSVGITVFPDDGDDVQTLLKNADIAMYKAKQAGKNRYQFYAAHMQSDARARMQMELDLRAALAAREFVLHYQPIVEADSGELVGAEALVRWQRPEQGLVLPLEFIPVAEDCGLIVPIGEWVLREAARQWAAWRGKGPSQLRISVNVSSVQFRQADFKRLLLDVVREFDLPAGALSLEITESVLMDSSREAELHMREMKELGVGFGLDDFGTGYSSLSYLKRFPMDAVKIDRSFVRDCPTDQNDAHLVEAIVNMAHSLGLQVIAEGVETDEQLAVLRNLGCDYVQGHRIGRPMPAASFDVLIERHQLLAPQDQAGFDGRRFLSALRRDELDVEK